MKPGHYTQAFKDMLEGAPSLGADEQVLYGLMSMPICDMALPDIEVAPEDARQALGQNAVFPFRKAFVDYYKQEMTRTNTALLYERDVLPHHTGYYHISNLDLAELRDMFYEPGLTYETMFFYYPRIDLCAEAFTRINIPTVTSTRGLFFEEAFFFVIKWLPDDVEKNCMHTVNLKNFFDTALTTTRREWENI